MYNQKVTKHKQNLGSGGLPGPSPHQEYPQDSLPCTFFFQLSRQLINHLLHKRNTLEIRIKSMRKEARYDAFAYDTGSLIKLLREDNAHLQEHS